VTWADTAKGVGLILVVLGHVLRDLVSSRILARAAVFRFVDTWIYSFHMPIIFCIRPFSSEIVQKSCDAFVRDKLGQFYIRLLIWSLINILIKAPPGSAINHPRKFSDRFLIPICPVDQLWFLSYFSFRQS
jgi:fucose 4-O-acetylase-like acetyltransferase